MQRTLGVLGMLDQMLPDEPLDVPAHPGQGSTTALLAIQFSGEPEVLDGLVRRDLRHPLLVLPLPQSPVPARPGQRLDVLPRVVVRLDVHPAQVDRQTLRKPDRLLERPVHLVLRPVGFIDREAARGGAQKVDDVSVHNGQRVGNTAAHHLLRVLDPEAHIQRGLETVRLVAARQRGAAHRRLPSMVAEVDRQPGTAPAEHLGPEIRGGSRADGELAVGGDMNDRHVTVPVPPVLVLIARQRVHAGDQRQRRSHVIPSLGRALCSRPTR
ncbi:hypothetical protein [Streptomyces sp. SPB162]|uniref:hypothetical protein n=1 Tax=Streptomyces sp. SPB162 TaxID=2940560 RepID=UPI00240509E0|nr:hypothetical protein [Streptomyces sp. SPB162]MDF9814790.1 hypothetical protein [Streptomyces sp. SPB162]